jgi:hypothetical protein
MSFTTLTLVKKHLAGSTYPPSNILNHPITLSGTNAVELPHHSLVENSESVKWQHDCYPESDGPITLRGREWADLAHQNISSESVVVSLDQSLDTVFIEEVDYQIDYVNGRICRVAGGVIPDPQPVYIFYDKYTLFARERDYTIDYSKGIIARTNDSSIPDGATILMDYSTGFGPALEDLITQAIIEAEDLVLRNLAPEFNSSSSDQGLQTGSTELVLSIISRDMANETLSLWRGTDGYQRAKEWRELSSVYEQRAYQTLAPFLLPHYMRSSQVTSHE